MSCFCAYKPVAQIDSWLAVTLAGRRVDQPGTATLCSLGMESLGGRPVAKQPPSLIVTRHGKPPAKVVDEHRLPFLRTQPVVGCDGPAAIIQTVRVPSDVVDVDPMAQKPLGDRDPQAAMARRLAAAAN